MSETDHISQEQLAACYAAGPTAEGFEAVRLHLSECASCRERFNALQAFAASLDAARDAECLAALGAVHPTSVDMEAFTMGEASEATERAIREHLSGCETCSRDYESCVEGMEYLRKEDPLSEHDWASLLPRKLAAGIEIVVEAAHGAFTYAGGMISEVMSPQKTVTLTSAPANSRGHDILANIHPSLWHDAEFQTDRVGGEFHGTASEINGRGVVMIVIQKRGEFMALAPIVELVSLEKPAIRQSALDMGDRYSANFQNLDEGFYLIGIREP